MATAILKAKGFNSDQITIFGGEATAVRTILTSPTFKEHWTQIVALFNKVRSAEDTHSLVQVLNQPKFKAFLEHVLYVTEKLLDSDVKFSEIEHLFTELGKNEPEIIDSVLNALAALEEDEHIDSETFMLAVLENGGDFTDEPAPAPAPAPPAGKGLTTVKLPVPAPAPAPAPAPPAGKGLTTVKLPVPAGKGPINPVLPATETLNPDELAEYLKLGSFVGSATGHIFKPGAEQKNLVLSDFKYGMIVLDAEATPEIYPVSVRVASLSTELVSQFISKLLKQTAAAADATFQVLEAYLIGRTFVVLLGKVLT